MAGNDPRDGSQLGFGLSGQSAARASSFDVVTWARAAHFDIPDRALSLLQRVESPAEAFIVRELFALPGALYDGGDRVYCHGAAVGVQVPALRYRVDLLVELERTRLAVEIDGLEYHGLTQAQFTRDHFRARQLLIAGYIVVRFTANEAMARPRSCWRDIFAVLATRRSAEASA